MVLPEQFCIYLTVVGLLCVFSNGHFNISVETSTRDKYRRIIASKLPKRHRFGAPHPQPRKHSRPTCEAKFKDKYCAPSPESSGFSGDHSFGDGDSTEPLVSDDDVIAQRHNLRVSAPEQPHCLRCLAEREAITIGAENGVTTTRLYKYVYAWWLCSASSLLASTMLRL
jgi:hypothetical protein